MSLVGNHVKLTVCLNGLPTCLSVLLIAQTPYFYCIFLRQLIQNMAANYEVFDSGKFTKTWPKIKIQL